MAVLYRVKYTHTPWPRNYSLNTYPSLIKAYKPQKDLCKNIYSSCNHNSPKLETALISISIRGTNCDMLIQLKRKYILYDFFYMKFKDE